MYFLNIGGSMRIAIKEILSYSAPTTAAIKRILNTAKEENRAINVTGNKTTNSLIFTRTGYIYQSPLKPETLDKRIKNLVDESLAGGQEE